MSKPFSFLAIITFCLFLVLLFSYEKLADFDQKMSNLLFDNDFLIAFHFFGETKLIVFLALLLIVTLFFIKRKNFRAMFLVVLTVGLGSVINKIVKNWVERPRPDIAEQLSSYSFPSAHAMLSLLLYFTIAYVLSKVIIRKNITAIIWVLVIVITLLTGISRVAESRHYATDVLAGWCLGYTWFMICLFGITRKRRNKI